MSRAKPAIEIEQVRYCIESLTEHDLLEVVEIEEDCGLSRWGWDAYRVELARREAIMLGARRAVADTQTGSLLSGFIAARVAADELHINNIGVRDADRRGGAGSALLRAALVRAERSGVRNALLEVRASNEAAQALYRHHGFLLAGRRRNYYRGPTEDALIMLRHIGD